jgi:crossover junction endodeoxyribonuclease RuvC
MRVLGIDPGAYGALALLSPEGLRVHDMPILKVKRGKTEKAEVDGYTLANILQSLKPDVAYIEQVGGITGQSASAAFNFGRAAGIVEGALKQAGVRVEFVPPQTWKRALKVNPGKDGSRAMAMRRWPDSAQQFMRVKDDGRAEAALIADYGRINLGGFDVFG